MEPGGVKVRPGTYRLVMDFDGQQSEQKIIVQTDPRISVDKQNIEEVYNTSKKLETYMDTATNAVKQLAESKQVLADYQKLFKTSKSDEMKSLLKEMKSQTKAIDSLISLFIGKVDKRQGIVRNPESNVMTRIGGAAGYIRSRQQGMTITEETLLKHAKNELETAVLKTNTFFNDTWPDLRSKIESENSSQFKEIEKIKLK
jgi:mRNA-degrading endonuclease RelE of RelBE toxin-antitoxin system